MQYEIMKSASAAVSESDTDMALINAQALKELTPEEIYTFKVTACDDLVDRDLERFPLETLEKLAPMFVGRTVIADHHWSTANQQARIYKTEVVDLGDRHALQCYCYMLRTDATHDVIAAIEGGILREVSVGCAIGSVACGICGGDATTCKHIKGAQYEGRTCHYELLDPLDAYELSFVAVPAQPGAGVTKNHEKTGWTPADMAKTKAQLQIENERWKYH